jgi:hypothetical protein
MCKYLEHESSSLISDQTINDPKYWINSNINLKFEFNLIQPYESICKIRIVINLGMRVDHEFNDQSTRKNING